jgi:hypothetical protein
MLVFLRDMTMPKFKSLRDIDKFYYYYYSVRQVI